MTKVWFGLREAERVGVRSCWAESRKSAREELWGFWWALRPCEQARGRLRALTSRVRETPARRCTITALKWDFAEKNAG